MRGVTADEAMLLSLKARGLPSPLAEWESPLGAVYLDLRSTHRFKGHYDFAEHKIYNTITPLGRLALQLYNSGIAR